MAIIQCPNCHAKFKIKDEYLGRRVRCAKCENPFEVIAIETPAAGAPAAEADQQSRADVAAQFGASSPAQFGAPARAVAAASSGITFEEVGQALAGPATMGSPPPASNSVYGTTYPPAAGPEAPGFGGGGYVTAPPLQTSYGYGYSPTGPGAVMQPQQRTGGNGMGITSMILGIVAMLGFCLPVINLFAVVVGVAAIVFGMLGISAANKRNLGKGMAISGIVMAVVAIILSTVITVWLWSDFWEGFDEGMARDGQGAYVRPSQYQVLCTTCNHEGVLDAYKVRPSDQANVDHLGGKLSSTPCPSCNAAGGLIAKAHCPNCGHDFVADSVRQGYTFVNNEACPQCKETVYNDDDDSWD